MSAPFVLEALPETAWQRRLRLAVEVVDAASGELIRDGIEVSAAGLVRKPIINFGGRFVWLEEAGATPTEVSVDPGSLPYLPATAAVPPPLAGKGYSLVRLALAPKAAYRFDTGVTGVRGTLLLTATVPPAPPVPLAGDAVWLQWQDDNQPAPGWTDAGVASRTDAAGDFAVVLRLVPSQIARSDAQGRMRVRVAATHAGVTQFSPETQIRPGYVTDDPTSHFEWDQFTTA